MRLYNELEIQKHQSDIMILVQRWWEALEREHTNVL